MRVSDLKKHPWLKPFLKWFICSYDWILIKIKLFDWPVFPELNLAIVLWFRNDVISFWGKLASQIIWFCLKFSPRIMHMSLEKVSAMGIFLNLKFDSDTGCNKVQFSDFLSCHINSSLKEWYIMHTSCSHCLCIAIMLQLFFTCCC